MFRLLLLLLLLLLLPIQVKADVWLINTDRAHFTWDEKIEQDDTLPTPIGYEVESSTGVFYTTTTRDIWIVPPDRDLTLFSIRVRQVHLTPTNYIYGEFGEWSDEFAGAPIGYNGDANGNKTYDPTDFDFWY